jgi:hypothetical protein
VTCITIIDTIILTNYTNDAYYCDTYLYSLSPICVTCITIIDTIILTNYTNDAYYCDTYLYSLSPICLAVTGPVAVWASMWYTTI